MDISEIAKSNVLSQYIIENANLRIQAEKYRLEADELRQALAKAKEEGDVD